MELILHFQTVVLCASQQRGFRESDLTEIAIHNSLAAPVIAARFARATSTQQERVGDSRGAARPDSSAAEAWQVQLAAKCRADAALKARRLVYATTQAQSLHARRNGRRLLRRSELAQHSAAAAAALAGVEPAAIEAAAHRELLDARRASSLPRVARRVHDSPASVLGMIVGEAQDAALLCGKEQLELWYVMRRAVAVEEAQHHFQEEFGRLPLAAELAMALGFPSVEALVQCVGEGQAAQRLLLQANVRLVLKMAYRWRWQQEVPMEDIVLAGMRGLEMGLQRFDPTRGAKLATAMWYYIQDGMHKGYGSMSRIVRLPQYIIDAAPAIMRAVAEYQLQNGGRVPTNEELQRLSGASLKTIARIRKAWSASELSLNVPTNKAAAADGDAVCEAGELLQDPEEALPHQAAFDMELKRAVAASLGKLAVLLPEHVKVMTKLYGLEDGVPKTSKQVGEELGMSAQRVREMKKKAMRALRTSEHALLRQLADDHQIAIAYSH
ncbi:hypothetical protein WJX72_011765 [[Myrmecia] bisecta]|uniref:RNA polymerase sigma-70 region 4 domain-containing protein n=1 Tax=[Myrmecia] bisecta TaxID=41462 RepID=A0AAW1PTU1_9CHLO